MNDDPEDVPQTDADMRSFIDDMSMATYGNEPAIYAVHGHMGQYLVKELRKKKGRISNKTTIVGSKYSHKLILHAEYRKIGKRSKIRQAASDLGLGRTGGLRRTMIGIKDRFGKARVRASKVSYLAHKNKKAKALYGTGVLPAATYGAEEVGYSPSMVKQLRECTEECTVVQRRTE